jgi:hypothetical protein
VVLLQKVHKVGAHKQHIEGALKLFLPCVVSIECSVVSVRKLSELSWLGQIKVRSFFGESEEGSDDAAD